jgi:hypothetical protein
MAEATNLPILGATNSASRTPCALCATSNPTDDDDGDGAAVQR